MWQVGQNCLTCHIAPFRRGVRDVLLWPVNCRKPSACPGRGNAIACPTSLPRMRNVAACPTSLPGERECYCLPHKPVAGKKVIAGPTSLHKKTGTP